MAYEAYFGPSTDDELDTSRYYRLPAYQASGIDGVKMELYRMLYIGELHPHWHKSIQIVGDISNGRIGEKGVRLSYREAIEQADHQLEKLLPACSYRRATSRPRCASMMYQLQGFDTLIALRRHAPT